MLICPINVTVLSNSQYLLFDSTGFGIYISDQRFHDDKKDQVAEIRKTSDSVGAAIENEHSIMSKDTDCYVAVS